MARFGLADERLPEWARAAIYLFVGSFFGLPLICYGVHVMITRHLPRIEKWDGTYWFDHELHGTVALIGGSSLVSLGLAFIALGVAELRWARGRPFFGTLPWYFVGIFAILYLSTAFLR